MTYLDRLLRAATQNLMRPGTVSLLEIQHDDDCAIWTTGDCDCDPDVDLVDEDGGVRNILKDGTIARGEDPERGDNPSRRAFLEGVKDARRDVKP